MDAYLERYAAPDKGWTDRSESRWPVPYWDIDTGMAALLMLLTATDNGLGGLFFGVAPECHDEVHEEFGIPRERSIIGVVALGYEVPGPKSPSLKRGKRGPAEVVHWGQFGTTTADPPRRARRARREARFGRSGSVQSGRSWPLGSAGDGASPVGRTRWPARRQHCRAIALIWRQM